jgi:phage anti-repressor protein
LFLLTAEAVSFAPLPRAHTHHNAHTDAHHDARHTHLTLHHAKNTSINQRAYLSRNYSNT